jgi:L-fuculose-phosphate aldolase
VTSESGLGPGTARSAAMLRARPSAAPRGSLEYPRAPAASVTDALRLEMCEVGRRMWTRGLCSGTEGNLSVRVGDDLVLCTPSGVSKGFLEPRSLRTIRLDGSPLDLDDGFAITSEIRVHLAVYRARPDVRAVVHSHAPHANVFAMAGLPLPEGVYPEADVVLGRVALAAYALPGTAGLAENVAAALTPNTAAMLLAHHGTLTMSARGLVDAYHRLEVLDSWCQILLGIARLGTVEVLTQPQLAEVLAMKRDGCGLGDDRASHGAESVDAHNAAAFAHWGRPPKATRAPAP